MPVAVKLNSCSTPKLFSKVQKKSKRHYKYISGHDYVKVEMTSKISMTTTDTKLCVEKYRLRIHTLIPFKVKPEILG